jgi:hypothetical protein
MTDPIATVQAAVTAVADVAKVEAAVAPVEAKVVAVDNKLVAWVKANTGKAAIVILALLAILVWKIL